MKKLIFKYTLLSGGLFIILFKGIKMCEVLKNSHKEFLNLYTYQAL